MTRDFSKAIDASQLLALSARLKGEVAGRTIRRAVGTGNRAAVEMVVAAAKANASTKQEQAVANDDSSFRGVSSPDSAKVELLEDTHAAKGSPQRFAFGAEFGARHDVERTVGVRKFAIGKTAGKRPRNVYARDYQQAHTMLGWNQFRDWRGSARVSMGEGIQAGYWLWPAVRDTRAALEDTVYGPRAEAIIAAALENPAL